ncbi:PEP-CTERM sorting domain-containing protein [Massilia sp. W12]|uniref:PEP-CTERM sorting domain-containing protein n=1 Tax=Massilia sp. W12 TaxID=3126507 RepID=UPI0030D46F9D
MRHLLLLALSLSTPAFALDLQPQNYAFSAPTACGTWCYHDPDMTKLTDGVVGNAGWAYRQGQEWAGWVGQSVVHIDFHFSQANTFNSVSVGSTQDRLDDVALPSFDLYAKENGQWVWKASLENPPSSANNVDPYSSAPHGFFTFSNLQIHSQDLRLSARANGPWTFIDEVRFAGVVPEAETWAMLGSGLGLLALAARRRRRA